MARKRIDSKVSADPSRAGIRMRDYEEDDLIARDIKERHATPRRYDEDLLLGRVGPHPRALRLDSLTLARRGRRRC